MKNKKGNSPLWLAANGGHLAVVEMLYAAGADIDSQDNRKVIHLRKLPLTCRKTLIGLDAMEGGLLEVSRQNHCTELNQFECSG